jgi:hypothetical protein
MSRDKNAAEGTFFTTQSQGVAATASQWELIVRKKAPFSYPRPWARPQRSGETALLVATTPCFMLPGRTEGWNPLDHHQHRGSLSAGTRLRTSTWE